MHHCQLLVIKHRRIFDLDFFSLTRFCTSGKWNMFWNEMSCDMGLSYERQHINMLIQPTLGPTEICVFVETHPTPHIPSQQIYHALNHMGEFSNLDNSFITWHVLQNNRKQINTYKIQHISLYHVEFIHSFIMYVI